MEIQNAITDAIDGIGYQKNDNGEIFLNLKDVAIKLGFERVFRKGGKTYRSIRWWSVKKYLCDIDEKYLTQEVGSNLYISESDFYCLVMISQSAKAKAFKNKLLKEILPAIKKYGVYIAENATTGQLECLLDSHQKQTQKEKK